MKTAEEFLQQALPIIKEMAESEFVYNDSSGDLECHYCNLACHQEYIMRPTAFEHDKECPIRLAAELLRDMEGDEEG